MYDNIDKLYQRKIQHAREGVNTKFEDEDQMQAQDEIFEMLLAAGYFRARISTLSPFDKILGGLAWSITSSNVDVDVDVFFSDDAPLGEKIDVGERVCKALLQMKCPHPLSSPQIRGLDFLKIFPVVQWLVKKVIETREETAELIRLFTESQFAKKFIHPEDTLFKEKLPEVKNFYDTVNEKYKPRRRFKRSTNDSTTDESTLVTNTLLEYGHHSKESKGESKKDKNKKEGNDELGEKFKNEYAAFNSSGSVSGSLVGSMIGLRSEELLKSQNAYELLRQQELSKGVFTSKQMAEEQFNRQVESRKRQMLAYKQTYEDLKQKHSSMFQKLSELQSELDQKIDTNKKIEEAIQKFNEIENSENASDIKTLRGLVALNESLKKQQEEFKQNCKKQLQEYKQKIENLQKGENELSGEEGERIKLIEETYNKDSEKLKQIKSLLAKKNRTILLLERKLDDIPSRTELTQYQREFVELFEQVAAKLVETRQYYNTYNTLEDQRVFLTKELSILDSINEKYNLAMQSKTNRENLLKSMQQIIESVEKNATKTTEKLQNEQNTRDLLKKKHIDLIEKQGYYVKLTKEFESECRKNSVLQQKLEESKN